MQCPATRSKHLPGPVPLTVGSLARDFRRRFRGSGHAAR